MGIANIGDGTLVWLDGNINADPKFADTSKDHYHLSDDSPCISSGTAFGDMPGTDMEGNPRPDPASSRPDIGAYESHLGERISDADSLFLDPNLEAAVRDALDYFTDPILEFRVCRQTSVALRPNNPVIVRVCGFHHRELAQNS
jgi:hypothetical protein